MSNKYHLDLVKSKCECGGNRSGMGKWLNEDASLEEADAEKWESVKNGTLSLTVL